MTQGHAVFIRNLSALYRKDPKLARRIDEVRDEDRPEVLPTRSGEVTVRIEGVSGATYLHSRYDPVKEARRLIDGVEVDEKYCFVVLGFGLGYHVRALHERLQGDAVIIVIEPSVRLLSAAFAHVDFVDLISSDRLVILDRLEKSTIHEKLKPFNTLMMLGVRFVVHPPSRVIAEATHAEARRMLLDLVAYSRMTLLTLVGNSTITCRNIAHNLPKYLSTPPIDILRDRFRGYPGIVISGGPSLRRNMSLLAEAKGKAVLCASQTLFKPLLESGIVPDFVTSLDFHAMSRQFFSGISGVHGVHLVAEPKVSWHVLDDYDGPVSLLHSAFAAELIGDGPARRDGLKPGATVAHLAFYLAQYMGCDPIIFVGQDLAFTGHCFYMPGVEIHNTWRGEINRFNTMETKEWERIVRNRTILRKIPDIDGREIYTDELLFTYLEQFERDFIGVRARIIDATEGGARMRGSELMTLREALERYASRPLPADSFAYRDTSDWNDLSKLGAARSEIEARIRDVETIHGTCEEILTILQEMKGLTGDPARFNRRIVRVDELRAAIHRSHHAYRIVNASAQLAELQRFTADRKIGASDAEGAELAKRQLARDIKFVESFRDAAATMLRILAETVERFDAAMGGDG